jgi:hypothetical protein
MLNGSRGDIRKQIDQALGYRRMRENRIAQHRVRQSAEHGRLNRRHHFARFRAKRGETQNAVAFGIHEHLYESARFANRDGSKHTGHRHRRQPIRDAPLPSFRFVQPDSREFRIGEHAERHEPVARRATATVQVFAYYPEIVVCDMRELRTAGTIAHSPNARRSRLQPVVYFDVAACVEFDSRLFEADPLRVRNSPRRDQ